jgi:hypothetical protein
MLLPESLWNFDKSLRFLLSNCFLYCSVSSLYRMLGRSRKDCNNYSLIRWSRKYIFLAYLLEDLLDTQLRHNFKVNLHTLRRLTTALETNNLQVLGLQKNNFIFKRSNNS